MINLLREQTLAAVADDRPEFGVPAEVSHVRPIPEPRTSFWGRKQSKAPASTAAAPPHKPAATVEVEQDMFSFRGETPFGLFETLQARAVLITVDVK